MLRTNLARFLALAFILGSYKGYIALFDPGSEQPRQVFPYAVTSLPSTDQQALKDGIFVENDGELCQLLEDYLS